MSTPARLRDVFVLAKHPPRSGERVLDVGCGFGETSLDLARLVGPKGSVVGFDVCLDAVAIGKQNARAARIANVSFVCGDAERHVFDSTFDMVFVRFLTAPAEAVASWRKALSPGGRLLAIAEQPEVARAIVEGAGFTDVALEPMEVASRSWCIRATNPMPR